MMLPKSLLLLITGLACGTGVAAGTFAFLLVVKVLPRMIQKSKLSDRVIDIENMVIKGVLFGTVFSLFSWRKKWIFVILGRMLFVIFGLSAGIFAGCIAVALAEILDTFPIFFRRLNIKPNLCEHLIWVMAFGKVAGSLFYFLTGYGILGK